MAVTIQLDQMTIEDKIRAMESLWDDLCHHADAVLSPSWHEEVLGQREKSIAEGKEKFIDWDIEKEKIRQSLK